MRSRKNSGKLPSFIHVDRDQLHKEFQKQPALAMKWSVKVADAEETVEELTAELELVEAEIDKAIRKDPKKFGVKTVKGEPREVAIQNAVVLQQRYQDAQRALRKARHRLKIYEAASNAISFQRKTALENLVDLWGRDYFSSPRELRDDS